MRIRKLLTNQAAYCASKGAVLNLTRQVALDYAKHRIHCNALCPGFTRTSMTKSNFEDEGVDAEMISMTPWGEWGKPDEVARGAVFLASDDCAWVTGIGMCPFDQLDSGHEDPLRAKSLDKADDGQAFPSMEATWLNKCVLRAAHSIFM